MKQGHRTLNWTIALLASMFIACGGNRPPVVQPPLPPCVATVTPSAPQVYQGHLPAGTRLEVGETLRSVNQRYTLVLQGDGNLVLYDAAADGAALWATYTNRPAGRLEMQGDGNLVLYDACNIAIWAAGPLTPGATLTLQNDGNLVLIANGVPLWASWSFGADLPWTPPSPPLPPVPAHPAPLDGMLRVAGDGRSFQDDSGDVTPVSMHTGDLLWRYIHDRARVEEAVGQMRVAGYQIDRSWLNLNEEGAGGFWGYLRPGLGPLRTPDYRTHVLGFANLLKANSIRWHMSLGGLAHYTTQQKEDLYRLIGDVMAEVGPEWVVLPGEVNEARDTTDSRDPREVERLVNSVRSRHPHNLYALSAYTGTEDRTVLREWTPSWMRFFIYHGYRHGHLWDKLRHRFSMLYEGTPVRYLAWETEAVGPGRWLSATQNAHELNDPEATPLMAALSTISRTIPTYTASAGIIFDQPLTDMPGFRTTPALVRKIPRDVMRWRLFHSGPGAGEDVRVLAAQGDVRIDGAADGTRRAMVIYGPPGSYQLPIVRSFVGEMCRTTLTAVLCDPVTLRAGDRLSVSFTVGRLLVGRVQ